MPKRKVFKTTHPHHLKIATTHHSRLWLPSVSGLYTNLNLWLYSLFSGPAHSPSVISPLSPTYLPHTPPPPVTESSSGGHGWRVNITNWLTVKINFLSFYLLSNEVLCQWVFVRNFVNIHINQIIQKINDEERKKFTKDCLMSHLFKVEPASVWVSAKSHL